MNIVRILGQSAEDLQQGVYYEYDRDSQPLGEGGMGIIFHGYRCSQVYKTTTPVAIKAVHDKYSNNPDIIQRAVREASIQIVNDNLMRMYGLIANVEQDPNFGSIIRYYIIMERLVGVNLDALLNGEIMDKSGITIVMAQNLYSLYQSDRVEATLRIIRNVANGIKAIHDAGFIHRDIDPSNVMVTIEGKIKLIDFGICKEYGDAAQVHHVTQSGAFIGKVNYAAPEQVLGDIAHQDPRTDIYSLGIFMYQLFTGELPFSGSDMEILDAQRNKSVPVNKITNKKIRRIVEKATQKVPENRYQSISEMIADMDSNSTGSSPESEPATVTVPAWLWALVGFAGIIAGIVIKFAI